MHIYGEVSVLIVSYFPLPLSKKNALEKILNFRIIKIPKRTRIFKANYMLITFSLHRNASLLQYNVISLFESILKTVDG